MKRRSRIRSGLGLAILLTAILVILVLWKSCGRASPENRGKSEVAESALSEPPELRARRVPSAEAPLLAHEELLTLEGDGAADISALADLTRTYLEKPAGDERSSLGFNEDLARALTDREVLGEAAIPAGHPVLRDGQLIDRWGTPWHVHPLASDLVELRSAGPDRRLFTDDDLVTP